MSEVRIQEESTTRLQNIVAGIARINTSSIAGGKVATTRDVGHWHYRHIRKTTSKGALNFKHSSQFVELAKGSKPLDIGKRMSKFA